MTRPHRIGTPRTLGDATPDLLAVAKVEAAEAREAVTTMRRLAGERRVGASEVSLAEYRLHRALERVAELDDGPDAA